MAAPAAGRRTCSSGCFTASRAWSSTGERSKGANHCAAVCCGKSQVRGLRERSRRRARGRRRFRGLAFRPDPGMGLRALAFPGAGQGERRANRPRRGRRVQEACWSASPRAPVHRGYRRRASIKIVGEVPGSGRIAVGSKGGIFGQDGSAHLWRYDVSQREARAQGGCASAKAPGARSPLTWAKDRHSGLLYTADADGNALLPGRRTRASARPWAGRFWRPSARWP